MKAEYAYCERGLDLDVAVWPSLGSVEYYVERCNARYLLSSSITASMICTTIIRPLNSFASRTRIIKAPAMIVRFLHLAAGVETSRDGGQPGPSEPMAKCLLKWDDAGPNVFTGLKRGVYFLVVQREGGEMHIRGGRDLFERVLPGCAYLSSHRRSRTHHTSGYLTPPLPI